MSVCHLDGSASQLNPVYQVLDREDLLKQLQSGPISFSIYIIHVSIMHYNPTKKLFIPESVFLFFVIISIPGDYRGMRTLTFNIFTSWKQSRQTVFGLSELCSPAVRYENLPFS